MAFGRALRYILTHDRKVRAACGGEKRVWPVGEVPQGQAAPYITYHWIGAAGDSDHQGGPGSLKFDEVMVTVWAQDYTEAETLRDYCKAALVGQSGKHDGDELEGVFEANRRIDPEDTVERSEHALQAASLLLKIVHRE